MVYLTNLICRDGRGCRLGRAQRQVTATSVVKEFRAKSANRQVAS